MSVGVDTAVDDKSLLQQVFGREIGALISVVLMWVIIMAVFMGIPMWLSNINNPNNDTADKLAKLSPETKTVINEIAEVQSRTETLLSKLNKEIKAYENTIAEKKKVLDDLQKQNELLKLTPEQLEIVEKYNKSAYNENITLKEWLSRKIVIYNLLASAVISAFFYWLGGQLPPLRA